MINYLNRVRLAFWTKMAERKFKNAPTGICCCGLTIENHPVTEEHQPRDMKEYAIESYVKSKINRDKK